MTATSEPTTTERAIWVTGASSGIGRAVAQQLDQRGYQTILLARREKQLLALAEQLKQGIVCPLDLAEPQAVRAMATQLLQEHGPPRALFNIAGYGDYQPVLKVSEPDHCRMFQVNYHAPAGLIQAVLPPMLKAESGHIINVASIAAVFGPWGHGPYAASKAALIALTQSLAIEHESTNIHFSYVMPGLIKTEFFDRPVYQPLQKHLQKRGMNVEAAARKIVRLLDHPRLELYIPRHYCVLNWIKAFSPQWLQRIISHHSKPA